MVERMLEAVTEGYGSRSAADQKPSPDEQPSVPDMPAIESMNVTGFSFKWPDWFTPPVRQGVYIGAGGLALAIIVL